MSDDLVQWLGEQLDDDYAAVQKVLGVNLMARIRSGKPVPRWVPSPEGDAGIWDTDGTPRVKFVWAREREHIIRWDPARVLRDIEARRAIVDDLAEEIRWAARKGPDYQDGANACERTLKRLALAYIDRPGYREE